MSMLKATVEATTTHEVVLQPQVKKKLLVNLRAYADLKLQRDAIDYAMRKHKDVLEVVMTDLGEKSLKVEGFTTTVVSQTRKTLDQKKLLAMGVPIETLEAATVEKATKPYVKVTVPGGNDED